MSSEESRSVDVENFENSVNLLQKLISFDTTNPPGNESKAVKFIRDLLIEAGIKVEMVGDVPERQNLIACLPGSGDKEDFLMYGHVDVVGADVEEWKHPPFEGVIEDGFVWGRGALDMKGPLSMMISSLLRLKSDGITPERDLIFVVLADEEGEGRGARYVVENYSNRFKSVNYAIGELGGFTLRIDNKKFYPIMISEKQRSIIKATIEGPSGHGSLPVTDGSMAKLGEILTTLNENRLPLHLTKPVKIMLESLAKETSLPTSIVIRGLLKPRINSSVLNLMRDKAGFLEPILRNTVNPTIVQGGNKINVVPNEITLKMDGRILPGFKPKDLIKELDELIDKNVKFEVEEYDPGYEIIDLSFYDTLADLLKKQTKDGIPIPYVLSAVTDARFFAKLGIQTYGFTPMILPKEINFANLIHSNNERIPIKALKFGTNTIHKLLKKV